MELICEETKEGTASPSKRAACGTVRGNCTLQRPPTAEHTRYMAWSRWLLRDMRLNPGTIYIEDPPFSVGELLELRGLGLNAFGAFGAPATLAEAQTRADEVASYVAQLDAHGLMDIAYTHVTSTHSAFFPGLQQV